MTTKDCRQTVQQIHHIHGYVCDEESSFRGIQQDFIEHEQSTSPKTLLEPDISRMCNSNGQPSSCPDEKSSFIVTAAPPKIASPPATSALSTSSESTEGEEGAPEPLLEPESARPSTTDMSALDALGQSSSSPVNHNEDIYEDSASSSSNGEEISEVSCLDQEVRRLKVLKSYLGVLDANHGNSFERLTSLASRISRAPMALVTIADLDKQYVISGRGWDLPATVKSPFCSHAVLTDCDFLVVPDASTDPRFLHDPQVTGDPGIRFYAGAPLVCPEGYKLGTLCVMDTTPRSQVPLDEKQGLMELAAMAMEVLVDLRTKVNSAFDDPAQQIACTAHDLLTPLTGIALSLSLLRDDENLQQKLSDQQKDMIETAANCSAVMNNICQRTMEGFRDQGRQRMAFSSFNNSTSMSSSSQRKPQGGAKKPGPRTVRVVDLVKNLNIILEPFPKQVPLIITVDPAVPPEFVSDDMKIFRSAANFLTNACAKTESGSIHLKIFVRNYDGEHQQHVKPDLVFACHDTGTGVDVAKYAYLFQPVHEEPDPLRVSRQQNNMVDDGTSGASRAVGQNTGLGLYSVATQISSIGGKYGFRPRSQCDKLDIESFDPVSGQEATKEVQGSVFWFSVPLTTPEATVALAPLSDPLATASDQPMLESEIAAIRKSRSQAIDQALGHGKIESVTGRRARFARSNSLDDSLPRYQAEPIARESEASLDNVAADSLMGASRKRLVGATSDFRQHQVLIIEDSLVVRKSIARALSKLGFEVTLATNGMEGLKELQRSLFDLVLCDFLMPVMDGLDCIQQYRQWEKANRPYFRQYIVGISAHASEKDVQQGIKVGMDDFRSKPVTYKVLVDLKSSKEFDRVSMELDNLGQEIETLKRRKIAPAPAPKRTDSDYDHHVCLVLEGSTVITKIAEMATEGKGWKIVPVQDGESALQLLRMRNWDAVLLDDELSSSSRCMAAFREWEKNHRVNRQNNVLLISSNFVLPHNETGSSFQVPTGFDGALGKPLRLPSLQSFLDKAAQKSSCFSSDIVTR
jgi:CheY-like chemotaxis protein